MTWLQSVLKILSSVFMQKETFHHIIIKSSFLMVFQPFSDFCDNPHQRVNLQWKMVKDTAKFFNVKFEGGTS